MDEVELLNAATGETQPMPPLPTPRSKPSITAVGRSVLVCGGSDESGSATARVDRFDAIGMRWVEASPLSTARTLMAAGAIDGKLCVCGGADRDYVLFGTQVWSSAECLDVERNRWTRLPAMSEGRAGAGAAVHRRCLYMLGGEDGGRILKSVERLSLADGRWQRLPQMSQWRRFHDSSQSTVAAVGDHLYVCDGMLGDSGDVILERLDTVAMVWERLPSPPVKCHNAALLACCGSLYVCGGGSVEELDLYDDDDYPIHSDSNREIQRFDPASGRWEIAANMGWMRSDCVALASAGFIYVFGGKLCYLAGPEDTSLPLVECFDAETCRRYALESSRLDFESDRRGILGACLCSSLPDDSVRLSSLWDGAAARFGLTAEGELPRAGSRKVTDFKRLYYNTYMRVCESCERAGLQLNAVLMQGLVAVYLSKAWRRHRFDDLRLDARSIEKVVSVLEPIVLEYYSGVLRECREQHLLPAEPAAA